MIRHQLTIRNKLGLHARAAARLVALTSSFSSEISIERNGKCVNGKSIMGVMMLAAAQDCDILLKIDGPDENEAMTAIEKLIRDRFGEKE